MRRPPLLLHGIPIENVTLDETIELIGQFVVTGRARSRTHQVATVNVDFLANAVDDASIAEILRNAELSLADGMPLIWAGRLLDMPIIERVAGADLVPSLIETSQTTGWHIHVFGSSPDVVARAQDLVASRYPHSHVTFDPGPRVDADGGVGDEVLARLAEADADIVCVALGNPKQERFIERHRARIGAPVMIGVGGSLDMMVGERRRAPRWVQRAGFEWVVRAAQEPRRLGVRYARDITVMGPWLFRQWRRYRAQRDLPGLAIEVGTDGVVARPGAATSPPPEVWARAVGAISAGAPLRIDPMDVPAVDGPAAAGLVGLVRESRRAESQVRWSRRPGELATSLAAEGVSAHAIGCDGEWQLEHPR